MQSSQTQSFRSIPQPFRFLLRLLVRMRESLPAAIRALTRRHRGLLEISGAVLLAGLSAGAAGVGLNPLLVIGSGLGFAVLLVVTHSAVVVHDGPRG